MMIGQVAEDDGDDEIGALLHARATFVDLHHTLKSRVRSANPSHLHDKFLFQFLKPVQSGIPFLCRNFHEASDSWTSAETRVNDRFTVISHQQILVYCMLDLIIDQCICRNITPSRDEPQLHFKNLLKKR